jgi:hypothetical protein
MRCPIANELINDFQKGFNLANFSIVDVRQLKVCRLLPLPIRPGIRRAVEWAVLLSTAGNGSILRRLGPML